MRALPTLIAGAVLAGCASSSGVFAIGDDRFQVSTRATWELGGRAGAQRAALAEATKHCQARGERLRTLASESDYGHFEGGTVTLKFSCVK